MIAFNHVVPVLNLSVDSLSLTRAGFIEYFLVATKLV
ncbi:hypothetical protein, partial [Pseudomonas aeruginosa]